MGVDPPIAVSGGVHLDQEYIAMHLSVEATVFACGCRAQIACCYCMGGMDANCFPVHYVEGRWRVYWPGWLQVCSTPHRVVQTFGGVEVLQPAPQEVDALKAAFGPVLEGVRFRAEAVHEYGYFDDDAAYEEDEDDL